MCGHKNYILNHFYADYGNNRGGPQENIKKDINL